MTNLGHIGERNRLSAAKRTNPSFRNNLGAYGNEVIHRRLRKLIQPFGVSSIVVKRMEIYGFLASYGSILGTEDVRRRASVQLELRRPPMPEMCVREMSTIDGSDYDSR